MLVTCQLDCRVLSGFSQSVHCLVSLPYRTSLQGSCVPSAPEWSWPACSLSSEAEGAAHSELRMFSSRPLPFVDSAGPLQRSCFSALGAGALSTLLARLCYQS